MRVQSLGREDPLKEGMAAHSRILAWRVPWTEEPGGLQSTGSQRVRHDGVAEHTHTPSLRGFSHHPLQETPTSTPAYGTFCPLTLVYVPSQLTSLNQYCTLHF